MFWALLAFHNIYNQTNVENNAYSDTMEVFDILLSFIPEIVSPSPAQTLCITDSWVK